MSVKTIMDLDDELMENHPCPICDWPIDNHYDSRRYQPAVDNDENTNDNTTSNTLSSSSIFSAPRGTGGKLLRPDDAVPSRVKLLGPRDIPRDVRQFRPRMDDPYTFLQQFEINLRSNGIAEDHFTQILPLALNNMDYLDDQQWVSSNIFMARLSWRAAQTAFIEYFQPYNTAQINKDKWSSARQGSSETAQAWYARYDGLCKRALINQNDPLSIIKFVAGFKPSLKISFEDHQTTVRRMGVSDNFATCKDAADLAIALDLKHQSAPSHSSSNHVSTNNNNNGNSANNSNRHNTNSHSTTKKMNDSKSGMKRSGSHQRSEVCHLHPESSHVDSECRQQLRQKTQSASTPDNNNRPGTNDNLKGFHSSHKNINQFAKSSTNGRGSSLTSSDKTDLSHISCYNCQRTGHYARDCPDKPGPSVKKAKLKKLSAKKAAEESRTGSVANSDQE
jgi:hypothetical protein